MFLEVFSVKSVILACAVGAVSLILTASGLLTFSSPIVTIEDGAVQGRIAYSRNGSEYFEYLGIPFAEPPVGHLRFQAPVPVKPWKELKKVTKYPPYCVQLDGMVRARIYGVEDCLYLNVFTHSIISEKKKPVMVYIHGGGFFSGAASMYGPKYFMDEDIVLVVISYRLGPLGFLNTGDGLIRGNMGLKDQNLALKWVQKNIENFGGDPNKVTIFGESAGAASVVYHLISNASKGLFQRAIAQSGTVLCPWSFNRKPLDTAKKYAKQLNCPTDNSSAIVDCLKNMEARDIVKSQIALMDPTTQVIDMFAPSVEGELRDDTFLAENPIQLIKSGNIANKVPLLLGVTSAEGGLRTARFEAMPQLIQALDKNWMVVAPRLLGYDKNLDSVSNKVREYYFGSKSLQDNFEEFRKKFTKMTSDAVFFHPVRSTALLNAQQGSPTYLYVYDYDSVMLPSVYSMFRAVKPDDWIFAEAKIGYAILTDLFRKHVIGGDGPHTLGATHGDDLFQLWNMEWIVERFSPSDLPFSQKFVKLFADFARNKEPLQFNGVEWPAIQPKSENDTVASLPLEYMLINNEGKVVPEPFADRMRFWESLNIRN